MDSRKTDVALFLLRAVVGVVFFAHGAQKVLGWFGGYGLPATVDAMGKNGFSPVIAYLVSFGELTAGLGLIVGLLTRIAAAGMFVEMLGAVLIVHAKNGFFSDKHGFEFPLTLCIASLAILILGPGAYAFDAVFQRESFVPVVKRA
jgi:putative oxidoreductase